MGKPAHSPQGLKVEIVKPDIYEGTQNGKLYRIVKEGPGLYTASIRHVGTWDDRSIAERVFGGRHQAFCWLAQRANADRTKQQEGV